MKKLLAAVVASAFAFGAVSTFAADTPRHEASVQRHVVQTHKAQHPKMHQVKLTKKKHHRHHRQPVRHAPR
jgi:Spy/CpxP family protein refolding chaperone